MLYGVPRWIWRLRSQHTSEEKGRFYDVEWNAYNYANGYPFDREVVPKPKTLEEVLRLSEVLSKDMRHVRVDLYELPDGRLMFSELTFTHWGGLVPFVPATLDEVFGNLITGEET